MKKQIEIHKIDISSDYLHLQYIVFSNMPLKSI